MTATSSSLKDKVIFITGASRGIGRSIALKCAKDGAKIVVAAKTAEKHPKLEGTIYTVAEEINDAGSEALPVIVDVRDESMVEKAVEHAVASFGKLDALINNASAINISSTLELPMKRYDLLNEVNARGTYLCSKICIPYLLKADNPHILNMSPPISLDPKWFKGHIAYTMSKYGMSMCTLGMSEEFRKEGIAVNSLWPKTIIATAAIANNFPEELYQATRQPEIVADAAHAVLTSNSRELTGRFLVDEDFLKARGVTEFDHYATVPGNKLWPDFYLE